MPEIPQEAVEAAEKVLKGNYWVEDYYAGRGEIAELAQATLEAAAPFLAAEEREARRTDVAAMKRAGQVQLERADELQARCAELEAERLTPEEAAAWLKPHSLRNTVESHKANKAFIKLSRRARASSPASVDPGGEA